MAMVRSGDVVAGLEHARRAWERLDAPDRTTYVSHVAGDVLLAVPIEQASLAREYREVIELPALTRGA